jgi:hypothetical protein
VDTRLVNALVWVIGVPIVLAVIGTVFVQRYRDRPTGGRPVQRPAGVRTGQRGPERGSAAGLT